MTDQLREDVVKTVRIGLKHARMIVEAMPVNKPDGTPRTLEEYRALLIYGISELEKEDLL